MVKTASHHPRQWHLTLNLAPFLYKEITQLWNSLTYTVRKRNPPFWKSTDGKSLEETCAVTGWLWSRRGRWWGRGVQSHWAQTGRSCLGPITHGHNRPLNGSLCLSWSGFRLAHHKSQKAPPATAHLCTPHPACWNEGLSWKKAIFYVTEQAKEHKCVRFKQVFS